MFLPLLTVLSTMHFEGDVTAAGGDYADIEFPVPAGTVEIQVAHGDGSDFVILDWGVWSPDGFRGWGGGLTDDAVIGVDESSRGYLTGPIAAGMWKVVIGKAQLDASGGHYIIDVTCRDNATLTVRPRAAFAPVVMATETRWYKGDFHVHSTESGDAHASLQDDIDLAHSQGLDFINLSDHNTIAQHSLVAAQQASWPVLVLRSSEITTYSGHGNGVGIHEYVDHRVGYNGRTIKDVIDDTVNQGGAFIVNHPATDLGNACIGCGWKHIDDVPWDEVSGMEVLTAGYDIGVQAFTPRVIALWDQLEDQGHRIAAVGGSDDHTAGLNEGTTGGPIGTPCTRVLATELSEAGIIAALRARHTQLQLRTCDDPLVELTVSGTDAGGHSAGIGDEGTAEGDTVATIHVTGGDGMFAQLWRNGENVFQQPIVGADATLAFTNEHSLEGMHRYRVEIVDDTGRRVVVTSHAYVQSDPLRAADVVNGCGCRSTSPAGLLSIAPALLLLRRRRRAAT